VRWEWEGFFQIEVDDDWRVVEPGDLVEIVPPRPAGAIHIRVLHRKPFSSGPADQASYLVRKFAQDVGAASSRLAVEYSRSRAVATANFKTLDSSTQVYWEVEAHIGKQMALVCTYCHDGQNEDLKRDALRMLSTIQFV
jgi:hypothetical protein